MICIEISAREREKNEVFIPSLISWTFWRVKGKGPVSLIRVFRGHATLKEIMEAVFRAGGLSCIEPKPPRNLVIRRTPIEATS